MTLDKQKEMKKQIVEFIVFSALLLSLNLVYFVQFVQQVINGNIKNNVSQDILLACLVILLLAGGKRIISSLDNDRHRRLAPIALVILTLTYISLFFMF